MKLIHTADWHLGKILYGRSLIEDQKYFLDNFFFPLLDKEHPDAVMISGDVFDRQIASAEAIRLFDDAIYEICRVKNISLFVSLGNHDGADRFTLGTRLLSDSGFYVATHLTEKIESVRLEGDGESVTIYMLPYFDISTVKDVLRDDSIKGITDGFNAVLSKLTIDSSSINILMAHCFVAGSVLTEDDMGYVGNIAGTDSGVFDMFDYVALGHLHAPQKAACGRYSGSPLKYSFDEENHKKSVTVLETQNGHLNIREIPINPFRDVRVISGSFDDLMESNDMSKNDYIYANLTGNPVFEPMARLRTVYPNILGLRNGLETTEFSSKERDKLKKQLRRTRPDDTMFFKEFFKQICGEEATNEDIEMFENIVKEGDL